jgi:sigma-B regulation protein RsbU (phosphoserine phosphatase)
VTDAAASRILLVEDDETYLRTLERRLGFEGYAVSCARDGREGMKAIVAFEPWLVISDWMMPHVDGLELCRAVKTGLGDEAPYFILLTAKDALDERSLALDTGADDYIVKPCEPGELRMRVRNGLRHAELRRETLRLRAEVQNLRARLAESGGASDLPDPLTLCSPCGRVRVAADVWEDLAHFVADAGLLHFEPGTCPDCLQRVEISIRSGPSRAA